MAEEKEPEKKEPKPVEKTDTFAQDIENINVRIKELKEKASQLRKSGKDPFFADFKLRNAASKVHFAEISREKKDRSNIFVMLDEAENELKLAEDKVERSITEEVDQMVEFDKMKNDPIKPRAKTEQKAASTESTPEEITKDIKGETQKVVEEEKRE